MREESIWMLVLRVTLFLGTSLLILVLIAPYIGLGGDESFILYKWFGIARSKLAFATGVLSLGAGLALILCRRTVWEMLSAWWRKPRKMHGENRFERHPFATISGIICLTLVAVVGTIEISDLFPHETVTPPYSVEARALRMREHVPNQSLVVTPTDEYIEKLSGSLEQRGYEFDIDDDGYIKPSKIHSVPDLEIVFLGGSSTENLYVDSESRFPYLSGRLLEEETSLKVNTYNGGMGGNITMHANLLMLGKVLRMTPDFVVLMETINDFSLLRMYGGNYFNENPYRSLLYKPFEKFQPPDLDAMDALGMFFRKVLPDTTNMLMGAMGPDIIDPGTLDEWAEV